MKASTEKVTFKDVVNSLSEKQLSEIYMHEISGSVDTRMGWITLDEESGDYVDAVSDDEHGAHLVEVVENDRGIYVEAKSLPKKQAESERKKIVVDSDVLSYVMTFAIKKIAEAIHSAEESAHSIVAEDAEKLHSLVSELYQVQVQICDKCEKTGVIKYSDANNIFFEALRKKRSKRNARRA